MKDKRRPKQKNTTRVAFFFFALVFVLITASLLLKVVSVVQKSSFDGRGSFVIGFEKVEEGKRDIKKTFVAFDPNEKSIAVLHVVSPESLKASASFLKIPLNKSVTHANTNVESALAESDVQIALGQSIVQYVALKTDMTIVDFIRLWMFAATVSPSSVPTRTLSFQKHTDVPVKTNDDLVLQLFADSKIIEEKVSIQVVNAADISGLGSSIGRLITNMGGNVVAVSTSSESVAGSSISYFGEETYTVSRLANFFGFKKKQLAKPGIADIVIELGEDIDKYYR